MVFSCFLMYKLYWSLKDTRLFEDGRRKGNDLARRLLDYRQRREAKGNMPNELREEINSAVGQDGSPLDDGRRAGFIENIVSLYA